MFSVHRISGALLLSILLGTAGSAWSQTTLEVRTAQRQAWVDVVVTATSSEHSLSRRNIIFPKFEPQWRRGQVSESRSSSGTSFSISIGSGRTPTVNRGGNSSVTLQMRIHPQRAGELTLGGFKLQAGGQVMDETGPRVFNFSARGNQRRSGQNQQATVQTHRNTVPNTSGQFGGKPQGQSGGSTPPGPAAPAPAKAVFYRWELEGLSRDGSVYAGQKVFATLHRYEHADYYVDGCLEPERVMPDFKGVFKERADRQGRRHGTRREGTHRYQTTVIGAYALYPYRNGALDLPVIEDECQILSPEKKYQIRLQRRRARRTDLDPYKAHTEPKRMMVKSLPKPLKNYVATVIGKPIVSGRLERKRIKGGESVRLITRLRMPSSGGRLADVPELELPESPDYEAFPSPAQCRGPRLPTGQTQCDERTKTWMIRPSKEGTLTIKGPQLVYFDPARAKYKTRSVGTFNVEVTSPPPKSQTADQGPLESEGPQLRSIREIESPETVHGTQGYASLVQWTLYGAPLLFLGFLGYERFSRRRDRTAGSRSARSAARRALKTLSNLDMAQSAQELHGEIHGVATQYVDDRFQVTSRGKTYAQLKSILEAHGVASELAGAFVNELETLDFARFTGMDHEQSASDSIKSMKHFIEQVEEGVA